MTLGVQQVLHPAQFLYVYVYGAGKLHYSGAQECLGGTVSLLNHWGKDGAHQTHGPIFYTMPEACGPSSCSNSLLREPTKKVPVSLRCLLQSFPALAQGMLPCSACLPSFYSCPQADEPFIVWSSLAAGFKQSSEICAKSNLVWLHSSWTHKFFANESPASSTT